MEQIALKKENINIVIMFKLIDSCLSVIPEFYQNNMKPVHMEFMDKNCIRFSECHIRKEIFPKDIDGIEINAYLLLEYNFDSIEDMDIMEPLLENISNIALEKEALDIIVADTPSLIRDTRMIKASILNAIDKNSRHLKKIDVILSFEKISDFFNLVVSGQYQYSFNLFCYGPINVGRIHMLADRANMSEKEYEKQFDQFMGELKIWIRTFDGYLNMCSV